jgi:histidinol-phosphatase (PHP family)
MEMKIWDAHMHCYFSGDSNASPVEMITQAKVLHLPGITFTDHLDIDYYRNPGEFDLDIPSYISEINELSQSFETEDFKIRCGIELGLQEHLVEEHKKLLETYHFHEVIGSIHQVQKEDPYYPEYLMHRDVKTAYQDYFDAILSNIEAFHNFDTLGHLDYVKRYIIKSAGLDADYAYKDYKEVIDEILKKLIRYDIALEINTGAFRHGLLDPNPGAEIIRRYLQLGGQMLTIGADAHMPDHIAYGFDAIPPLLKNAGFTSYTVFENRKPIEVELK